MVAVQQGPIAWYDNGKYVGSTPPGAFKETEVVTQQLIKQRIKEKGFQDPMFAVAKTTSTYTFGG